uniref:F-box domain-containing protein n=1 Tax=Leptocylindrus danicus TaxID=163516 RepID=A0A7S2KDS6_9STRA|mmetsp:Transcript_21726/g.32455  ORF Transcript_21726/g.32455 Transcript_21726/m.32455 type:complete len:384 (+) Transcript_21726:274-1425(+)|eukprot:CAMPEP_0116048674 /NCGR_PEP_ID=MMETSP0321-20121206/29725_1 /TAXON_ID=163516 /ORGANISM="Leptocylindrus danicus var. danicus, Strain B650" /LENGTH=383 /DNA_ID=CAMNT_0003530985 /DNA_START=156 /DNA_END=1307 /DNA_ORIENTATION=-
MKRRIGNEQSCSREKARAVFFHPVIDSSLEQHEEREHVCTAVVEAKDNDINPLTMPIDIIGAVFSFLEFDDVAKCSLVSSDWSKAISSVDNLKIDLGENSEKKLRFAIKHLRNLTKIHLICSNGDFDSDIMEEFLSICITSKKLKSFSLDAPYFILSIENALKSLFGDDAPNLELFRFSGCRFATISDLIDLLRCKKQLKVLDLSCIRFNDDSTYRNQPGVCRALSPYMSELRNLEELNLFGWDLQHFDEEKLFSGLKLLKKLNARGANDASLAALAKHCSHLQMLGITDCFSDISIHAVLNVLRKSRIKTLRVPYVTGTGSGVVHMKEVCEASKTIENVTVGLRLWHSTVNPTISWKEKEELMVQATAEASNNRVNLRVHVW